ncbi:MAG TPA: valine--tRNA ligase, partial [Phycisphaeraceae bacterium]|nr:valine--tRNA ligase [Phycisphaeraceae bacterium]
MSEAIKHQLPKVYSPAEEEPSIRRRWRDSGAFHPNPRRVLEGKAEGYCIIIPPPNVTAALHLGHALNNTLQDIMIRYHRMAGYETLWLPGTDHAGIATQTVVDKRLKAEGEPALADYKKLELQGKGGRDQFIAKVQQWKDEYEARISHQLEEMGCSCDWDRQRFTMDEQCARAVREAFFRLFSEGLIYRGKRLVNWDPATQTALADDEVEDVEIDGHFWYMSYPLIGDPVEVNGETIDRVTVATTRPETMLGDTAVALNPKDPRAKYLVGRKVRLPLVNREIPIIEDDYVVLPVSLGGDENDAKAQFATGYLKVTPAHDPNDWEIGQRNGLEVINILSPDGKISDQFGWP